jgi:ribosome biogenesis GTPase
MIENHLEMFKKGRVLKGQNGLYTVKSDCGLYQCRSATKIRKEANLKILTGDHVHFADNGDGTGFITSVSERKNSFIRPAVANTDMLLIVVSAAEPDPVPYNIDRLSVLSVLSGASVYIVITKSDIVEPSELIEIYGKTPFPVTTISIYNQSNVDEIRERLNGKITVFTGASGAGKSSLINILYPQLKAEVGDLSEKIKRGKNTTRVTELFPVGDKTYIADTPGFTMLDVELFSKTPLKELIHCFPDLAPFTDYCRYTDCTHTKEEECGVTDAVRCGDVSASRHNSYVRLYEEIKSIPKY